MEQTGRISSVEVGKKAGELLKQLWLCWLCRVADPDLWIRCWHCGLECRDQNFSQLLSRSQGSEPVSRISTGSGRITDQLLPYVEAAQRVAPPEHGNTAGGLAQGARLQDELCCLR